MFPYKLQMYTFSTADVDAKFTELLTTVKDKDLRDAMRRRLKRNAHLVVGVVLCNDDNKICLVQEAKEPHTGKWNIPLGHLEHNEAMSAGAKRELKEETGYDVELTALLPPQNASCDNVFRILFVGKVIGGSPEERIKTDTSAVDWFTIDDIKQKVNNQELRDIGAWYDILLYQNGPQLPLNTIKEVEYSEL